MITVPITRDIINKVIATPGLNDLAANSSTSTLHNDNVFQDIENDVDCVLDWLSPFYPIPESNSRRNDGASMVVVDPSARVKAAIRSCLKHEVSQIEFTKLYINSIRECFNDHFKPFVSRRNGGVVEDFVEIMNHIKIVRVYYNQYVTFLNLGKLAHDLFDRNLHSLIYLHVVENSAVSFQSLLTDYLINSLFHDDKPSHAGSGVYSTSVLQDYIKILISIGLTDLLNAIVIQLSIKKIKHFVIATCAGVWHKPLLDKISDQIKIELYPSFNIVMRMSSVEFSQSYLFKLIKIGHDELVSLRIREIYQMIVNFPMSSVALSELHQCISFRFSKTYNSSNHSSYMGPLNQGPSRGGNHSANSSFSTPNFFTANLIEGSFNSQAYQRAKLVDTFIQACQENLLHSGANTVDVITTYASTIKSFLIIDPKGVLLDKVVRPIRRYLKTREDIIIKLVHGLLDDNEESNDLIELARELRKVEKHARTSDEMSISGNMPDTLASGKSNQSNASSDVAVDDLLDLNWVPDPIDALPDFKKGKVTDIIESLISIFDSKDIFIDEFTKLFGEKLINLHDYNLKDIVYQLELLKARFGKSEFTTLDVMIRDVEESKQINIRAGSLAQFNTYNSMPLNFHSTILSHLYWPTVCDNLSPENDYFKVPGIIEDHFQRFNQKFSSLQSGRYLKMLPSLGLVKLELSVGEQNLTYNVSPDKASVITLFNDETKELTLDFISTSLSMPSYVASKAIEFWVKEKVLIELTKDTFKANERTNCPDDGLETSESPSYPLKSATTICSDDNSVSPSTEKQILWPYINTILSNISPLPVSRLHSLLTISIPKETFDMSIFTLSQLENTLDSFVDDDKLLLQRDSYALK